MSKASPQEIIDADRKFVWHPYSSFDSLQEFYPVESTSGSVITLADGRELIDGMASWWSAIHGYNHPVLNNAMQKQIGRMSHVMFGGLTHEPATSLCQKLVELTPTGLEKVFLSDSGSVGVEVALKMAIQYWKSQGNDSKHKFVSLKNAYHGDTLGAMSVCDPVTGMHHLFSSILPQQLFAEAPPPGFSRKSLDEDFYSVKNILAQYHEQIAAFILEPIVQGAGGMRFYSPEYLAEIAKLCKQYDILLIADEIATGFGRTGKLFACEHADIKPDILCVGKALTGGCLTLAATLCTDKVAMGICEGEAGVFMHGPTFMGNPLACATANASIDLLLATSWQANVKRVEQQLKDELFDCQKLKAVAEVRALGAIGVVELHQAVNLREITREFVAHGIWVRPFGKLVYIMPPYNISEKDLRLLTTGIYKILAKL